MTKNCTAFQLLANQNSFEHHGNTPCQATLYTLTQFGIPSPDHSQDYQLPTNMSKPCYRIAE